MWIGRETVKTYEFLILATVLDLDVWFAALVDDIKGEMLDDGLNL